MDERDKMLQTGFKRAYKLWLEEQTQEGAFRSSVVPTDKVLEIQQEAYATRRDNFHGSALLVPKTLLPLIPVLRWNP